MINFNPSVSSIGSLGSVTLPKANAVAAEKQGAASSISSGNASGSSSASSFGPATRVDLSEQATRMKPARYASDPNRRYDVLAEVKKSVAEREGKSTDATKTGDTTKANETTETKSSKPARYVSDPDKRYDVLAEVKKSVAAREAAANEAAKKAAGES